MDLLLPWVHDDDDDDDDDDNDELFWGMFDHRKINPIKPLNDWP